jgi:hypothetical protein
LTSTAKTVNQKPQATKAKSKAKPKGTDKEQEILDSLKNQSTTHGALSVMHSLLYKDGFRKTVSLLKLSVLLNIALAIIITVLMMTTGIKQVYFAVDAKGSITKIIPLDVATPGERAVSNFVGECISNVYTFNYKDYKKRLNDAYKGCFTPQGSNQFTVSLQRSGLIRKLLETDGNVSMVLGASPSEADIKHGEQDGVHAWQVNIPVIVTREDLRAGREYSINYVAVVTIVRTEGIQYEKGIAITQFILEPVKG